jgi:hypothetical protein
VAENDAENGDGAQGVDRAVAVGRCGGFDLPDEVTDDALPGGSADLAVPARSGDVLQR